jgi:hypothetical protein
MALRALLLLSALLAISDIGSAAPDPPKPPRINLCFIAGPPECAVTLGKSVKPDVPMSLSQASGLLRGLSMDLVDAVFNQVTHYAKHPNTAPPSLGGTSSLFTQTTGVSLPMSSWIAQQRSGGSATNRKPNHPHKKLIPSLCTRSSAGTLPSPTRQASPVLSTKRALVMGELG